MPVGRFRTDPAELDDLERRVSARQYPEGALVVGMGVGIAAPFLTQQLSLSLLLLSGPVGMALGPVAGGVGGYLLGHRYRQWKLAASRAARGSGDDTDGEVGAETSERGGGGS
ncbi:hypothetical protein [Salinirussus salinus]|uniref:hypothetical protein n=1 Tax=Salinirussus salinus TaxID=1198300 RepID=UPI0019159AE1|nr:hypothetical protein [Salinirussus salinus]